MPTQKYDKSNKKHIHRYKRENTICEFFSLGSILIVSSIFSFSCFIFER